MREALRSLALHRLRATLSALGIVCGVVSFVAMISLSEGAREQTLAQIEQLGMRNVLVRAAALTDEQRKQARGRGSRGLSLADADRLLSGVDRIARVGALREVVAQVVEPGSEGAPAVLAVTPNFADLSRLEVASGRFLAEDDMRRRSLVCVLGREVSRRLGREGDIGGTVRVQGTLCKVVGVLRHFERRGGGNSAIALRDYDNAIVLALGVEDAFATESGAVSELIAEMRSPDDVLPALPSLRRALDVAHRKADDYRVVAPQELLRQARQSRRNFDILAASLATVCLLVGGIGIMNTMLASVTERTPEIGLRRAVGATRSRIARQFLAEAGVLAAGGAIAGVVLGVAGVLVVSAIAGWPVSIGIATVLVPCAAAIAAGLFFGIHPALQAARMDPIRALRHE